MAEKIMLIEYALNDIPYVILTDKAKYWLKESNPPDSKVADYLLEKEDGAAGFTGTYTPNTYSHSKPVKLWVYPGKNIEFVDWDGNTVSKEDANYTFVDTMLQTIDEDGSPIETIDDIRRMYQAVECYYTVWCDVCETYFDEEDTCDHVFHFDGDLRGPGKYPPEDDKNKLLQFFAVLDEIMPDTTKHILEGLKSGNWDIFLLSDMFSQSIFSNFGKHRLGDIFETALEDYREQSYVGFGWLYALQKPKECEKPYLDLVIEWLEEYRKNKET